MAGLTSLVSSFLDRSEAGINNPGAAGGALALNANRVTINAPTGYLNLAKGFGFNIDPKNCSSDGYPVTTPTAGTFGANPNMPLGYYGQYVWKWTGLGSMQISGGPPMIVTASTVNGSSGTVWIEVGAAAGDIGPGNHTLASSFGVGLTAPRTVFSFGWNIQSISNNGSGLIRITTKTGFASSVTTGLIVNISGANANTGANGVWTITAVDNQNFDLQASTFTNAQAGAGGTAVYAPQNLGVAMWNNGGTFSGMSDLVVCRSADEAAITAGLITDGTLVTQLRQLMGAGRGSPGWLRFMDSSGVQSSFECDFSQRIPATYLCYTPINFRPGYWTPSASGAITNGGSDVYSCADPSVSVWSGSSYIDNAIVQGTPSATNSGGTPTLNVGGHGAKPVFNLIDGAPPFILKLTGGAPSPGTDVLQFTFSAGSWVSPQLNGGSNYVFNYPTVAGDGTLATLNANLLTALVADATLTAAKIIFVNPQNGVGPFVLPRTAQQQRLSITYTSGPAIAQVCNMAPFSAATTNAVTASGNVLHFAAVPSTIFGGMFVQDTTTSSVIPPNTTVIGKTSTTVTLSNNVTGGGVASGDTINFGAINNSGGTFVYNYLLDGWIYRNGGMTNSIPLEAIVDMCNQVGANCWWCWGITKGAWVTAVTQFFGDAVTGITSGLRFGGEPWNELWNSSASPFAHIQTLGASLGWGTSSFNGVYSYASLKMIQYDALSKLAWTGKGRSASDYYVFQPTATFDVGSNGNFDSFQLKGNSLVTSNNTYATYGGLNGGSAPDHSTSPNRPVDITTATGCAPYWASPWFGGSAADPNHGPITGTVVQNAPWLQASLDYTNGLTTTAFTSMVNQFNGTTLRSGGSNVGNSLAQYFGGGSGVFATLEALCAQYDAGRPALGLAPLGNLHYEGGPQWGIGADPINGVNSVSSADITALANRMTALSWNVSAYTVSGTDNKTECATQVITMTQAWKYDASYKNLIKASYYQALVSVSGSHRETRPAQYGYAASQWCLFPVSYFQGNQYTNYDAISEFNT